MQNSLRNSLELRSARTTADFMFQSARESSADDQVEQQLSDPGSPKQAASRVVNLCVGGTEFVTTLATLIAVPGSYLAVLFSGRWAPSVYLPGTCIPFVDRDPASFKYVLAYLRSLRYHCQVILPDSPLELKQLHAEAEFYGLPELARACRLGRFSSALDLLATGGTYQRTPSRAYQRTPSGMHREPTFGTMQKFPSNSGSDSQAWNSFVNSSTALRSVARQPDAAAGDTAGSNSNTADGAVAISGEDVQLHINQHQQQSRCLAQSVYTAQQVLTDYKQSCASQPQQRHLADLILKHLLHAPLAARQPDLVAALAVAEEGTQLQFSLQYFPIGDLRIDVECKLLPAGCTQAAGLTAPAAITAADIPSPELSPREGRFSRPPSVTLMGPHTTSGSLLPSLAAAQSRPTTPTPQEEGSLARSSPSPTASAVTPGPGWGGIVAYHKYNIRETADKFTLTTIMPGEAQAVEEALRATYRQELNKYCTLHKLVVQQCPRSSVASLMWSLEAAGFASVKLSTTLETYLVGANSYPGYKSILTFEL